MFFIRVGFAGPLAAGVLAAALASGAESGPWGIRGPLRESLDAMTQAELARPRPLAQAPAAPAPRMVPRRRGTVAAGAKPTAAPAVSGVTTSAPPFTLRDSFQAVGLREQVADLGSPAYPPDTMGAVGLNHVVQIVNGSFAVFSKAGQRLRHVSIETFFRVDAGGVSYPRGFAFDPRVIYDRISGRWMASALERNGNDNNHLLLAVSETGDPMGTWLKYVIQMGVQGWFTDYETLGCDEQGVYVAASLFGTSDMYARVAVLLKEEVLAGSGTPSIWFYNVTDMYSTPQPALTVDSSAHAGGYAWLVTSSDSASESVLYRRIWWERGRTVQPRMDPAASAVSTPAYGAAPGLPGGRTVAIDAGDDRLLQAICRGGRLWTCRNVGVGPSGTASGVDRTACEWLELATTPTGLSLLQSGRVFDAAASQPRFYAYPSLAVNGQGHMAIGFSGARSGEFVGAYFTGRKSGDPAGEVGQVRLIRAGEALYQKLDGRGRNRWGDYSYTSIDPVDDMTLWTIQEYAGTEDHWGNVVARLVAPSPRVVTVSPARILRGQTNLLVRIVGEGFYDPGSSLPQRISVALLGGSPNGVSVTSVLYQGPAELQATLSVSTDASLGFRDMAVTNPDGGTGVLGGAIRVDAGSVALTVGSRFPGVEPPAGPHTYQLGSVLTCVATNRGTVTAETGVTESWRAAGWTGTGSVPAQGTGTVAGPFSITVASSIEWQWALRDIAISNRIYSASTNYLVPGRIRAGDGVRVSAGAAVGMEAGESVVLSPGFHAETGSSFRAVSR